MPAPEEILAEARAWLGTPFRHQGRCKGVGVDCIGLIVGVARGLGLPVEDRADYPRQPDGSSLEAALDGQLLRLGAGEMRPADVLLMRIRRLPQHVGIIDERGGVIHAHSAAGRVVEMRLNERWWERVVAAYRFPDSLSRLREREGPAQREGEGLSARRIGKRKPPHPNPLPQAGEGANI